MPEYLSLFYIFNTILCLSYLIIRNYGETYILNMTDTWGFKRETQIFGTLLTIIILRFLKYFSNWKKFIHECFFYFKIGISIATIWINYKLSCWYIFCCIAVWLLCKPPSYQGPTKVLYIPNEEIFNSIIVNNMGAVRGKVNYWFVIFYSKYSDECIYTEEWFANWSIKYSAKHLRFGKIDVDNNEVLATKLKIKWTGMKIVLPYIIMFKDGVESERFPGTDKDGHLWKVKYYREKEITKIFNLDELKQVSE